MTFSEGATVRESCLPCAGIFAPVGSWRAFLPLIQAVTTCPPVRKEPPNGPKLLDIKRRTASRVPLVTFFLSRTVWLASVDKSLG